MLLPGPCLKLIESNTQHIMHGSILVSDIQFTISGILVTYWFDHMIMRCAKDPILVYGGLCMITGCIKLGFH